MVGILRHRVDLAMRKHPSQLMPLSVYTNLTPDQWRVHPKMPHTLHHMDSLTSHCWASSSTHVSHADMMLATLLTLFPNLALPPLPYIDNISAIQIINTRRPTERTRHIDIQAIAIQDWKEKGDILMHHILGVINPSDSLTKPTGWVLHSRHCRRVMGHYAT
jgi:hypothetical protein